jgi:hypothetical protein
MDMQILDREQGRGGCRCNDVSRKRFHPEPGALFAIVSPRQL